jgi:hypothetical protein
MTVQVETASIHDMSSTDYVIDIVLLLLVVLQVRERRLDPRSLLIPVVVVAYAASKYLKSFPTGGHDVLLDVVLMAIGLVIGTACAATTRVWVGEDGTARSKAGVAAAMLWVLGIGSRMAFQEYSAHGGAGAIGRFSAQHQITSAQAWTTALVLMALAEVIARLVLLRVRAFQARPMSSAAVAA